MKTKHRLLVLRLNRDCTHSRLSHGRPKCACISRIGLVRLHKRANK
jgi:hypothetical protein